MTWMGYMDDKTDKFTFSESVEEEVRRIWWEEDARKAKGSAGPKPVEPLSIQMLG